jgi:hypothetical protein
MPILRLVVAVGLSLTTLVVNLMVFLKVIKVPPLIAEVVGADNVITSPTTFVTVIPAGIAELVGSLTV